MAKKIQFQRFVSFAGNTQKCTTEAKSTAPAMRLASEQLEIWFDSIPWQIEIMRFSRFIHQLRRRQHPPSWTLSLVSVVCGRIERHFVIDLIATDKLIEWRLTDWLIVWLSEWCSESFKHSFSHVVFPQFFVSFIVTICWLPWWLPAKCTLIQLPSMPRPFVLGHTNK